MPSEVKTPNYGLNQWQGHEYFKRQDFVDDNEIIDAALKQQKDALTHTAGAATAAQTSADAAALAASSAHSLAEGAVPKRCLKTIDPNETREWYLNQRIAGYVAAALSGYDCRVMRADDVAGATDVPLSTRVSRANAAKADLFVSIHHNAGINGGSGGGICVYTCNSPSSVSLKLAQAVYDATVKRTGLKGNRAKGLWQANFTVIANTSMPAILGEFGFMDSTADVSVILSDNFARECALGVADGIVSVAGLAPVAGADEPEGNATKPDDSPSEWAKEACEWAVDCGLVQGDGDGNYDWHSAITLEAMATLLYRYQREG